MASRSRVNPSLETLPVLKRESWNDEEIFILRERYKESSKKQMTRFLPGRTWQSIKKKASRLGVIKYDGSSVHVHNNGYVLVRDARYPKDWKGRWKDGRVYEHYLQWYLHHPDDPILDNECIHHVNGKRDDNRIENLEKMNQCDHGKLQIFFGIKKDERIFVTSEMLEEKRCNDFINGDIDVKELEKITLRIIEEVEGKT
jgi:hypothetical protein